MKLAKVLFLVSIISVFTACQPKQSSALAPTDSAIIGGTAADNNEFPFLVNIWLNSPGDSFVSHLCGGSLVSKNWVLTAAHCMLEDSSDKTQGTVKLGEVVIYLGSNNINGQGGKALKIKSILIHPDFSWPTNDIALVELAEPVTDVTPISLNQKDLGNDPSAQQSATIAGWGLTDKYGQVDGQTLQKVTVPIIDRNTCAEDPFMKSKQWPIGPDVLCGQTTFNTKTACPGDSGGPLFQSANGRFLQVGVVSFGSACRIPFMNNKSNVDGYADVSHAYKWITSIISK